MELFPAIDLHDGAAVRLVQGDFGRAARLRRPGRPGPPYAAGGARVDPRGRPRRGPHGRAGEPRRRPGDRRAPSTSRCRRAGECAARPTPPALLDGGVDRVVLGTAAVETPDAGRSPGRSAIPGRVAVGLDHRGGGRRARRARAGSVPAGRRSATRSSAWPALDLGAVVVTAIDRDGMLGGPDLDGLRDVARR